MNFARKNLTGDQVCDGSDLLPSDPNRCCYADKVLEKKQCIERSRRCFENQELNCKSCIPAAETKYHLMKFNSLNSTSCRASYLSLFKLTQSRPPHVACAHLILVGTYCPKNPSLDRIPGTEETVIGERRWALPGRQLNCNVGEVLKFDKPGTVAAALKLVKGNEICCLIQSMVGLNINV